MSHCTKFDFQYTDRKIICRTFQALNLEWEDGVVSTYASSADKKANIVKSYLSAIIAKKNGFSYFMEVRDKYYELVIEKHDMSAYDLQIAQEMAEEFRNTYIKEVAKVVVKKMESQGKQAKLEKTSSGYEIRFGLLYDKSILIKFDNGRVIEEVKGVKGKSCVSLTEALENMLSSDEVDLDTEWTSEYYDDPDNGRVAEKVLGAKGNNRASINKALGNTQADSNMGWKSEYYNESDNELTTYNLEEV